MFYKVHIVVGIFTCSLGSKNPFTHGILLLNRCPENATLNANLNVLIFNIEKRRGGGRRGW